MASTQKKKAAAKVVLARVKAASGEALVAPRAMSVMPDDAETIPQVGKDALAAPAAEIQQTFRSALEKGVVEFARSFRQGQDRRG